MADSSQSVPRRRKRWPFVVGGLLVLLLLLVALAPTLLSTGPGKNFVLSFVNGAIKGEVTVESLSLSWLGGQKIEDLKIKDPSGATVVDIASIDVPGTSLFGAIRGSQDYGRITIVNRAVTVEEMDESGATNLMLALESTSPEEEPEPFDPAAYASLKVALDVSGGKMTYKPWQQETVELTDLSAEADSAALKTAMLKLNAKVRQGDLAGSIAADVGVNDIFDSSGGIAQGLTIEKNSAIRINDLPSILIVRLLKERPELADVIGKTINANIEAGGTLSELDALVTINAEHLNANIPLVIRDGNVATGEKPNITLTVTEQTWPKLMAGQEQLAASKLLEPLTLELVIDALNLPRKDGALAWPSGKFNSHAVITDLKLDTGLADVGTIAVRDIRLDILAETIAEAVQLKLGMVAENEGKSGKISLDATLANGFDAVGAFNKENYALVGTLSINDAPLAPFDQLLELNGAMTRTIGPVLAASVTVDLKPDELGRGPVGPIEITTNAEKLKWSAKFVKSEKALTLERFDDLSLAIDAQAFNAIKSRFTASSVSDEEASLMERLTLAGPVQVRVSLRELAVPITDDQSFDTANLQAAGALMLTNVGFLGDPMLEGTLLQSLTVTIPSGSSSDGLNVDIAGQFISDEKPWTLDADIALIRPDQPDAAMVYSLDGTISGLPASFVERIAGVPGQVSALTGPTLEPIELAVNPVANGGGGKLDFSIDMPGEDLAIVLAGNYDPAAGVLVDPKSGATVTLTPQNVAALLGSGDGEQSIALLEPTTGKLSFGDMYIALLAGGGLDYNKTRIAINVESPGAAFRVAGIKQNLLLDQLTMSVNSKDLRKLTTLRLDATHRLIDPASGEATQGKIESYTRLTGLVNPMTLEVDVAGAGKESTSTITRLPTAFVEGVAGQSGKLVPLVGSSIEKLELSLRPGGGDASPLAFTGAMNSANVDAKVTGTYLPSRYLRVDEGSIIELNVTPAGFASLMAKEGGKPGRTEQLVLADDAMVTLNIRKFAMDWKDVPAAAYYQAAGGSAGADATATTTVLNNASVKADIDLAIPRAKLRIVQEGRSETFDFENIAFGVKADDLNKPVKLALNADLATTRTEDDAPMPGKVVSNTSITGLINEAGEIAAAAATYRTNTTVSDIPVAVLEPFTVDDGTLPAFLGEAVSMQVSGDLKMKGEATDLDVQLSSGNLSIPSLKMSLGDNLRLREPTKITMMVTPEVADRLLKWGNPILIDARESKAPIEIVIPNKFTNFRGDEEFEFNVPLAQFSEDPATALDNTFAAFEVKLGTLLVEKDGWFLGQVVRGVLRGADGNAEELQEAEFTPWSVRVIEGKVRSNDLWMVTDTAAIGVQGLVHIALDPKTGALDDSRSRMDVFLGMSGQTLLFSGIPGLTQKHIPIDEVYEFPVSGPMDKKPQLDFGHVAVKIGELQAKLEAQRRGGGLGGLIAGGIDLLSKALVPEKNQQQWPNHPKRALIMRWEKYQEKVNKEKEGAAGEKVEEKPTTEGDPKAMKEGEGETAEKPTEKPAEKPREKTDEERVLDALEGLFGGGDKPEEKPREERPRRRKQE